MHRQPSSLLMALALALGVPACAIHDPPVPPLRDASPRDNGGEVRDGGDAGGDAPAADAPDAGADQAVDAGLAGD